MRDLSGNITDLSGETAHLSASYRPHIGALSGSHRSPQNPRNACRHKAKRDGVALNVKKALFPGGVVPLSVVACGRSYLHRINGKALAR